MEITALVETATETLLVYETGVFKLISTAGYVVFSIVLGKLRSTNVIQTIVSKRPIMFHLPPTGSCRR